MSGSHWLPGLVVLSVALVIAAVYLLVLRKQRSTAPDPLADATERAEALLAQVREHDAERHQLEPAAWEAERDRLERLAADALRVRDGLRSAPPQAGEATRAPVPTAGFFTRHPQLLGAAWGGGVVVFFGALGLWLAQDQKPRTEGQEATGTAGRAESTGPAQDEVDPQFASLLARVQESPGEDLGLTSEVVRELIRRSDLGQAAALNDRSLSIDPFRAETRVHRAFLQGLRGQRGPALEELRRVADLWPGGTEGLLFSGMLHLQAQEGREALRDFEGFLAETPPNLVPPQLRQGVAELRRQVSGRP